MVLSCLFDYCNTLAKIMQVFCEEQAKGLPPPRRKSSLLSTGSRKKQPPQYPANAPFSLSAKGLGHRAASKSPGHKASPAFSRSYISRYKHRAYGSREGPTQPPHLKSPPSQSPHSKALGFCATQASERSLRAGPQPHRGTVPTEPKVFRPPRKKFEPQPERTPPDRIFGHPLRCAGSAQGSLAPFETAAKALPGPPAEPLLFKRNKNPPA